MDENEVSTFHSTSAPAEIPGLTNGILPPFHLATPTLNLGTTFSILAFLTPCFLMPFSPPDFHFIPLWPLVVLHWPPNCSPCLHLVVCRHHLIQVVQPDCLIFWNFVSRYSKLNYRCMQESTSLK